MIEKKESLKSIVPPLELCRMILSERAFAHTALVWVCIGEIKKEEEWIVVENNYALIYALGGHYTTPAPTLAEILEALPTIQFSTGGTEFYLVLCDYRNKHTGWGIGYGRMSNGAFKGLVGACKADKNPATAALKLWLEVKRRGGEK